MPYAVREALASFRRRPVLTGLSALMIGLSLLVVGLFGIAAHNIARVLEQVESRVEIVAYLRDDAPPDAVRKAEAEIGAFGGVQEVLYISREHALEIARAELGEFESIFSSLDVNPLPASLEIRLDAGQRSAAAVTTLAERVADYPIIEEVRYGDEWLDKVFLLRRVAGAAALVLGSAFAAVAALIIGSAVRMAIFARREEIVIMRLVGATDGYIRRPFLLEGLLTGLIGAIFALGCSFLLFRLLSNAVFQLAWIPDVWILGGVAAGGVLGVIASAIAVRRHLREI